MKTVTVRDLQKKVKECASQLLRSTSSRLAFGKRGGWKRAG